MSSSGGKFHCQDSPPWAGSPFHSRSTKYHDNPLFKSSPTDKCVVAGELLLHGEEEDFKENCADNNPHKGEKVTKLADWSSLTKTGSKRVLGERNLPTENVDFCGNTNTTTNNNFDVVEPPKSIRALAFPPVERDEEEDRSMLSPMSSSPASPSPRFQVPLTPVGAVSPTRWSESSDDSVEVEQGHNYDPNGNLRTPRPRFLRYRPDWRLEFLSSLELGQEETLASVFSRLGGEMPADEVTDNNNVADDAFDSETNTSCDDLDESEVLKAEDRSRELIEDLKRYEAVDEKEVLHEEKVEEEASSSPRVTWRVATVAFLLGTLFTVALLTTVPDFLERLQQVNYLSKRWQTYSGGSLTAAPDMFIMDDDWEWIPEYDITEGYNNQTRDLQPFETSSPELYELLHAILYGTGDEVEEKYTRLMEHEKVELQTYDQLADELLQDNNIEVVFTDENSTPVEKGPEQSSLESAEPATELTMDFPRSMILQEAEPLPIINVGRLHEDLGMLKGFLSSRLLPMLARTLVAVGTLLGVRTLVAGTWKRLMRQPKGVQGSKTPATPLTSPRGVVKPKIAEDLVLTPECLKFSPYGSYTAYKRTVMNEGSDKELVKLTPVRRSSRIRSHHQQTSSPVPACRRRVL